MQLKINIRINIVEFLINMCYFNSENEFINKHCKLTPFHNGNQGINQRRNGDCDILDDMDDDEDSKFERYWKI